MQLHAGPEPACTQKTKNYCPTRAAFKSILLREYSNSTFGFSKLFSIQ